MNHYDGFPQAQPPGTPSEYVLHVGLEVWQRMMAYVMACPVEIGGFGYIERVGATDFVLHDAFILSQTVTAVGVDIDAITISQHLSRLAEEGYNGGLMRFQWHSHVNMPAYFSGIDLKNIEDSPGNWHVSLVTNKRGEFEARLDVNETFRFSVPVNVVITYQPSQQQLDQAVQDITSFVRQPQLGLIRTRNKPVKPLASTESLSLDAALTAPSRNRS